MRVWTGEESSSAGPPEYVSTRGGDDCVVCDDAAEWPVITTWY